MKAKTRLRISGSSATLALSCAHWVGKEVEEEEQSDIATEGVRLHALAEAILRGEVDPDSLTDIQDQRCARIVKGVMAQPGFEVLSLESAWAYSTETSTCRPIDTGGHHRNYGELSSDEIPFTIDLIYSFEADGKLEVVVCDWKFGPAGLSHYTAHTSAQLALGAAAATVASSDGATKLEFRALDGSVSDYIINDRLTNQLLGKLGQITGEAKPGDHCTFCKYKPQCSAGQAIMLAPIQELLASDTYKLSRHLESEDHARWTLFALGRIEREVEDIKQQVKEYAKTHTLVDKDGRVYEERKTAGGYSLSASKFSKDELRALESQGKATYYDDRSRWGWYKKGSK